MNRLSFCACATLLALAFSAPKAHAGLLYDDSSFAGATTINFEDISLGLYASFGSGSVTFEAVNGSILHVLNDGSDSLQPIAVVGVTGTIKVDLSGVDANRIGFDYNVNVSDVYLEVFDENGVKLYDSEDDGIGVMGEGFLGWESNEKIGYVLIHNHGSTFSIDNFKYEYAPLGGGGGLSTPEPGSMLLLGFGAAAVGLGLRRRRKALPKS